MLINEQDIKSCIFMYLKANVICDDAMKVHWHLELSNEIAKNYVDVENYDITRKIHDFTQDLTNDLYSILDMDEFISLHQLKYKVDNFFIWLVDHEEEMRKEIGNV